MSKQTLKLCQTDSKFLEMAAHKIVVNGEEWFFMPWYFHKAADGIFVEYPLGELPNHVREYINTERGLNAIK